MHNTFAEPLSLKDYAREGLRTLVLAKKDLTVEEYTAWAEEYRAARLVVCSIKLHILI